jgi:glycosyl transferase family 25
MTQAIPVYIVNLARRPERLARLGGQLDSLGIRWQRIDALDALQASEAELDAVIAANGPLGRLGNADRACTISHMRAWALLLAGDRPFALVLEDDVYVSGDTPAVLATTDWIPADVDVVKLEKFGGGAVSTVLLGPALTAVPGGQGRMVHRMHSRHVGGGAYLISRRAAAEGMKVRGRLNVPVDHLLFNANVSDLARRLKPTLIRPAMATQRHYGYSSDVAPLGKAVRPKGWRRHARSLKRGFYDVRRLPQQVFLALTGHARLMPLSFADASVTSAPSPAAPTGWRGQGRPLQGGPREA